MKQIFIELPPYAGCSARSFMCKGETVTESRLGWERDLFERILAWDGVFCLLFAHITEGNSILQQQHLAGCGFVSSVSSDISRPTSLLSQEGPLLLRTPARVWPVELTFFLPESDNESQRHNFRGWSCTSGFVLCSKKFSWIMKMPRNVHCQLWKKNRIGYCMV